MIFERSRNRKTQNTMQSRLSSVSGFLKNALVRRVNLRIVRFWRSTRLVEIYFGSSLPSRI